MDNIQLAVFGNPIGHSKSPQIHGAFAKQCGDPVSYEAIEAPIDGFAGAVETFFLRGGVGANVTVPFKVDACELAQQRSQRAKLAGAANTLIRRSDGSLMADNTDGQGLVDDLTRLFGPLGGKRLLLIGAGGACRGVVHPLLEAGVSSIHIVNRTQHKAEVLAGRFQPYGNVSGGGLNQVPQQAFDIVVNGTSSSLQNQLPGVSADLMARIPYAYDMVYGDKPTTFMQWAIDVNPEVKVADGLGMLVGQAAASYALWLGHRPDIASVITELRRGL